MRKLVRCGQLQVAFHLADHVEEVVDLLDKYHDMPMIVADACLVRMSELAADPLVYTTDADFLVYRRPGRQAIPCLMAVVDGVLSVAAFLNFQVEKPERCGKVKL